MDEPSSPLAGADSRPWARAFALVYDPVLWPGERLGMSARRRELLARARGRTLEIGSGTGLNIRHYPPGLQELILAEPEPAMRVRLERRLARSGRTARLIEAPAERLPLEDASLDTVVCTLVLCTVSDPEAAVREMKRVLRADGQILLIEHVRADSPLLARWQDRLVGPWRRMVEGCVCNRPTAHLLAGCGLELELRAESWRGMVPLLRPLIVGRAAPAP